MYTEDFPLLLHMLETEGVGIHSKCIAGSRKCRSSCLGMMLGVITSLYASLPGTKYVCAIAFLELRVS